MSYAVLIYYTINKGESIIYPLSHEGYFAASLLPSGLYRRLWNVTRSADLLIDNEKRLRACELVYSLTAGQDFHLALKADVQIVSKFIKFFNFILQEMGQTSSIFNELN